MVIFSHYLKCLGYFHFFCFVSGLCKCICFQLRLDNISRKNVFTVDLPSVIRSRQHKVY